MEGGEHRDTMAKLLSSFRSGRNRRREDRSSSSSEGMPIITRVTTMSDSGPSQEEVSQYFSGLAGRPKLVARSIEEPFIPKYNGSFPAKKMIFNLGQHPIVRAYEQGPRMEIRDALRGLPWFKIDIIRIGYSSTAQENPIVVLITVEPGSVSYLKGQDTVQICRGILLSYNLNVHVEMMEGEKPASFAGAGTEPLPIVPYERIPRIGQSIGPHLDGENQASGTLGLYLTIKGNDSSLTQCALTCHHVAFPAGVRAAPGGPNEPFNHSATPVIFDMDQPSTQDHNALQKDLNARREAYTHQLTDLIEKRVQAEQGIQKPLTQKQLDNLNVYQGLIQEIDKILQGTNQFSRAFGKVISSSGIATDPKHGNTADWALVGLNMNRFNQRPKNIVPDFEFTSNQLTALNSKLCPLDIFTPRTADTHLTTHVKLQEALNHTTMDTDGFPTFRVMKYGRTTHWTAGVSNELWSDCQREPGRITTEWCILDLPSYGRFSEGGDSGSIVFDYKGRIVGVLHGGGAPKFVGMDMTYITPIEWLFENIEKTLGATIDLD